MLTSDGSFTEANTFEAYGCFARRRMEIWFCFSISSILRFWPGIGCRGIWFDIL